MYCVTYHNMSDPPLWNSSVKNLYYNCSFFFYSKQTWNRIVKVLGKDKLGCQTVLRVEIKSIWEPFCLYERSIHTPSRVLFQLLDRVYRSSFTKDPLKGLFSLSVYCDCWRVLSQRPEFPAHLNLMSNCKIMFSPVWFGNSLCQRLWLLDYSLNFDYSCNVHSRDET